MATVITTGLSQAHEIYADRGKRIREVRKDGKKVAGYLCLYPPVELITATGMIPFRIFGDMSEPITAADQVSTTVVCPFLRSILDLGLKGKFNFLDGIVGAHTCDIGMTMIIAWRDIAIATPFIHYIDIPHTDGPSAVDYFEGQLNTFKRHLEEFTGEKITDDKLRRAVELHNRQRKLVRDLYDLRKSDPPLLTSTENLEVLVALFSLPVEEGNTLLEDVIRYVNERMDRPVKKKARLLVWGPVFDNTSLYDLIESAGASVVVDDTCVGTRAFWADVKPPYDMHALAERYLVDIKCPRTYRQSEPGETKRDYDRDLDSRFNYIRKAVTDWQVNGAILQSVKYCDTHGYEVPNLRHYFDTLGIPTLYIEHDYSERSLAPIKTRVEAFVETLG
ncbi:MAG: 2-hydroxyacyl-CoA dehydratase [Dehalococcoidia bacterium]|nr:2-hydroxyacyl-CoA dehydratase [Dehalococcoidia bacterium]